MDDYIHSSETGGTKRFKELIHNLSNFGDIIHLFIPVPNNIEQSNNIHIHPIKRTESKVFPNLFLSFIRNYKTLKRINKLDYDSAVLISVPYGIQGALLGLRNVSLILWEDFIACRKMQLKQKKIKFFNPLLIQFLKTIEALALRKAQKIIVQSGDDLQKILKRHKNKEDTILNKTFVINNNVNASWIIENQQFQNEKPVEKSENQTNIYFVGNVKDSRKGLHILLGAMEMLLDKGYRVRLFIIGGGKLMEKYEHEYSKREEIEFIGLVENPVKFLKKADLLVVPSLVDSFPNTIMEGLYMEIPVMGAKSGGIPEMLIYEDLLFEPRIFELYKKIATFIDQDQAEKLKELVIQRKKELTFDWGKEMSRILAR